MRSALERKNHVVGLLTGGKRDAWVATADHAAHPHLVPFSLDWDGQRIIMATEVDSKTVHNLRLSRQARLAVGDTHDVVLIDAATQEIAIPDLEPQLAESFAERNGWDPRQSKTEMVWLIMTPQRVLAWNDEAELAGRTIMRQGVWLA